MPDMLSRFAAEHFVLNSITDRRRDACLDALRKFERSLDGPIERADANDVRSWLAALMNRGLAASTVGWHLGMLQPFYRWCWEQRIISADDYLRIQTVKPPRGAGHHVPKPYSHKELMAFWGELEARFPHTTPLIVKRWRNGTSPYRSVKKHTMRCQLDAMVELALVCGLRRSEIYNLGLDDAHWDNSYLVVRGKRVDQHEKVREVPYPDSTRAAMERWMRTRVYMGVPHDFMWVSANGPDYKSPLSPHRMPILLHSIGERWTWHRFRHTCATERLRAGMEIEKLQRFLGHANISMTLRYAQLLKGDVHKSAQRVDADFQRAIRRRAA